MRHIDKEKTALAQAGDRRILTRREFAALLGALAASVVAGGCGGGASSGGDANGVVTVTDYAGRSVEVPVNPQRVAALDSFTGELAVMAGAGEHLVAVPNGVKSDVLLQGLYSGLEEVAAPMSSGAINMEELLACNPQVVLVKEEVYSAAGQAQQLDKSGLPYVVVGYQSIDEQIEAIKLVAQILGGNAQTAAESIASYYRSVVDECTQRAAQLSESERVCVYHAVNALVATDGNASLGRDWIETVGCIDVSAQGLDQSATDYTTTLEQIYAWDPDVIVCNSASSTEYLLSKDNCAGLRAVKSGACHTIPVGATRWGQPGSAETYLGMLWLGCTVYPELYAGVDLQERVTQYYKEYLGIEVTDDLYQQMLSGEGLRQQSKQAGS